MKPNIGRFVLFSAPAIAVFLARTANAASCVNDIDCTAGGSACGTEICSWPKGKICVPAAGASPSDSWCGGNYGSGETQATANAECKCHAAGATCNLGTYHCAFFEPRDAGGASDSGSTRIDASSGSSSGAQTSADSSVLDVNIQSVETGGGNSGSSGSASPSGSSSSGGSSSSVSGPSGGSGSSSSGGVSGGSSGGNAAGGVARTGSSSGGYGSAAPGVADDGGAGSSAGGAGGYGGGSSQSSGCDIGIGRRSPLGGGPIVLFALLAAKLRRRRV